MLEEEVEEEEEEEDGELSSQGNPRAFRTADKSGRTSKTPKATRLKPRRPTERGGRQTRHRSWSYKMRGDRLRADRALGIDGLRNTLRAFSVELTTDEEDRN